MIRIPKIEQFAAALYDDELPYHNFGHVIDVLDDAEKIINKCKQEQVVIDPQIVYLAVLFHDAGFNENHLKHGFESKEAFSASLAVNCLEEFDYPRDVIDRVKAAILATHCDAVCTSNEDKAVRAADLSGLAGDYAFFKSNTIKLKQELEMLGGTDLSWEEWQTAAARRIELFLREDVDLTSDYYNAEGESVFREQVRENLRQFLSDKSEQG